MIIEKWRSWLQQPYPYDGTPRQHLRNSIQGMLFVGLFLYLFRPFGMRPAADGELEYVLHCLCFGLATLLARWVLAGIALSFPRYFREDAWSVQRELGMNMLLLILIGLANLWTAHWLYGASVNLYVYLVFLRYTVLIGMFPVLFAAYTKQRMLDTRYSRDAQQANASLHTHPASTDSHPFITLIGDNQDERIRMPRQSLLYIEAADNYAKVVSHTDGSICTTLLRATLKQIEQQLSEHPRVFRCHRTYIINLDAVVRISGNAQGYKLHLPHTDQLIPVSRSLNATIDTLLSE